MNTKTDNVPLPQDDFSAGFLKWTTIAALFALFFIALFIKASRFPSVPGLMILPPAVAAGEIILEGINEFNGIIYSTGEMTDVRTNMLLSAILVYMVFPLLLLSGFIMRGFEKASEYKYKVTPSGFCIFSGSVGVYLYIIVLVYSAYANSIVIQQTQKVLNSRSGYDRIMLAAEQAGGEIAAYYYTSTAKSIRDAFTIKDEYTGNLRFIHPDDFRFASRYPEYKFMTSYAGNGQIYLHVIGIAPGKNKKFDNKDGRKGLIQVTKLISPVSPAPVANVEDKSNGPEF